MILQSRLKRCYNITANFWILSVVKLRLYVFSSDVYSKSVSRRVIKFQSKQDWISDVSLLLTFSEKRGNIAKP